MRNIINEFAGKLGGAIGDAIVSGVILYVNTQTQQGRNIYQKSAIDYLVYLFARELARQYVKALEDKSKGGL